MPARTPQRKPIIVMRGTEEYERALYDLQRETRSVTLSDLADRALRELAARHGRKLPGRSKPVGVNQHAEDER